MLNVFMRASAEGAGSEDVVPFAIDAIVRLAAEGNGAIWELALTMCQDTRYVQLTYPVGSGPFSMSSGVQPLR